MSDQHPQPRYQIRLPPVSDTLLKDLASRMPEVEFIGPTESQLVAIDQLAELITVIKKLCQDVVTTGQGDWLLVAHKAELVADRCRTEDRMATELRLIEERKAR